jgi:hypothetical protein
VQTADRSAHADAGIHHRKRSLRAECVTADVAADIKLKLLERINNPLCGSLRKAPADAEES